MRSWSIACGLAFVSLAACGSREDDGTGAASGGTKSDGGAASGGLKSDGGAGAQNAAGASGASDGGGTSGGMKSDGGAAGNGNPNRNGGVVVESSWDTVLSLAVTNAHGAPNSALFCENVALAVHLRPNGDGLDAIAGVDGSVGTGHLIHSSAGTNAYTLDAPLSVARQPLGCLLEQLKVHELLLYAWDDDGDGVADALEGSGKASARYVGGDVVYMVDLAVNLWKGLPDQTPPSLIGQESAHPLDIVTIRASEPLALSTELALFSGSGVEFPLTSTSTQSVALGTFASSNLLPFQTTLTVTGHGADLAGLNLDLTSEPRMTRTLDDPGIFLQDGFETPPFAFLQNNARVVSGVGDLPAISGAQSLFVEFPSSTFDWPFSTSTLHLQRAPGAKSLRLAARILMSTNSPVSALNAAEVGVIGGTKRSYVDLKTSEQVVATGDASWPYAGNVQQVSVDLADEGPDVVVRIAKPSCPSHPGLCPRKVALLIDDVRIE